MQLKLFFGKHRLKAIASIYLIFCTVYLHTQQSLIREILINLKQEIIPQKIRNVANRKITSLDDLISSITMIGIWLGLPYLYPLSYKTFYFKDGVIPLSMYTDPDNIPIQLMARKIGLNTNNIFITEDSFRRNGLAAAAQTLSKGYVILGKQKKPSKNSIFRHNTSTKISPTVDEKKFIVGHELIHLQKKHILKKIASFILCPWILRTGLIIANTCTQRALSHIADTKLPIIGKFISHLVPTVSYVCLNENMQSIYSFFINRTIGRRYEKEADVLSAQQFNCAQAGYTFMKKMKDYEQANNYCFHNKIFQFYDVHPSCETRMNYLKKLADKQAMALNSK